MPLSLSTAASTAEVNDVHFLENIIVLLSQYSREET